MKKSFIYFEIDTHIYKTDKITTWIIYQFKNKSDKPCKVGVNIIS